jgi:hypothetical protein
VSPERGEGLDMRDPLDATFWGRHFKSSDKPWTIFLVVC